MIVPIFYKCQIYCSQCLGIMHGSRQHVWPFPWLGHQMCQPASKGLKKSYKKSMSFFYCWFMIFKIIGTISCFRFEKKNICISFLLDLILTKLWKTISKTFESGGKLRKVTFLGPLLWFQTPLIFFKHAVTSSDPGSDSN